jgi:mannose-6-phosphate isomerase-like protein (cupin superfamily)
VRLLFLGSDAEGRSCIIEQKEDLDFKDIPGLAGSATAKLFGTQESPPKAQPPGEGRDIPNGLSPGHLSWYVVNHEPYVPGERHTGAGDLHYRDGIDLIYIVEGGGDMMLGDGAHPVMAGDCILMPGTSHRLRPAPQGCRLMVFAIGATPA